MSTISPIFPMPHPHHFSDYGFDPQIDYFQVLEEARKHKLETTSCERSIDSLHFKLQKPVSKDDCQKKKKKKGWWWWKNAMLVLQRKWVPHHVDRVDVHEARARAFRGSVSGPVYVTESRSWSKGDPDSPYLSLRELTMEQRAVPIYLVT